MAIGKLYGTAPSDVIVRVNTDTGDTTADFGPYPSGTVFTAWTAYTGGSQITTLYDAGQNPVSVVIAVAPLYRTIFYGPSTISGSIWLQDPDGNRWRLDPDDLASRAGVSGITGIQLNGDTQPPFSGVVNLGISSATLSDSTDIGDALITAASTDVARAAIGLSAAQLNAIIDARIVAAGGVPTGPGGSSAAAVYDTAVYDTSTYQ